MINEIEELHQCFLRTLPDGVDVINVPEPHGYVARVLDEVLAP